MKCEYSFGKKCDKTARLKNDAALLLAVAELQPKLLPKVTDGNINNDHYRCYNREYVINITISKDPLESNDFFCVLKLLKNVKCLQKKLVTRVKS